MRTPYTTPQPGDSPEVLEAKRRLANPNEWSFGRETFRAYAEHQAGHWGRVEGCTWCKGRRVRKAQQQVPA